MKKLNRVYGLKYQQQKDQAKNRNIEWYFTYDTWLDWWGDDIINRGRKSGQLVMARNGDIGPYHPDNVHKATCGQNSSEAHLGKTNGPHSNETKAKISARLKGNTNGLGNPGNTTKGPRPALKGRKPWNYGLTKETDSRIKNPYAKEMQ